jgi:hypothetical protein
MSKTRNLVMLTALTAVFAFGTACFRLFAGDSEPPLCQCG